MNIVYFAALREQLNTKHEQMTIDKQLTVFELKKILTKKYSIDFDTNILCAVNKQQADDLTIINDIDEVAFYPPVTGG